MSKMKREEIDRIILESFQETEYDIFSKFLDNVPIVKPALEEDGAVDGQIDFAAHLISCIMTAQTSALFTMRRVLHRLICGDDMKPMQPATGGNKHDINK